MMALATNGYLRVVQVECNLATFEHLLLVRAT